MEEAKTEIKKTLMAIGISVSIREIDYNKAMVLISEELSKYETLIKRS